MAKARGRCLPMNFTMEDATCGIIKERARIGSSLADVDPMNINNKVHVSIYYLCQFSLFYFTAVVIVKFEKQRLCMLCTVTVAFFVFITKFFFLLLCVFHPFSPMQKRNLYNLSHRINFISDFPHQLRKSNSVKFAKRLNHCFN